MILGVVVLVVLGAIVGAIAYYVEINKKGNGDDDNSEGQVSVCARENRYFITMMLVTTGSTVATHSCGEDWSGEMMGLQVS